MRKPLAVVLAAMLVPAALSAQKVPPVKNAPAQVLDAKGAPVQQAQAQTAAVAQVRAALAAGKLTAWGGGQGGGIRPATISAAGALFNPAGGKNGTPVWVVGVKAPNARGHVRVTIDARTGAAVGGLVADTLDWGDKSVAH